MLRTMREKMQGIIAGAIVGIIAISFALWGIQNYLHETSKAKVLAKVNGAKITEQQVAVAYERAKRISMSRLGSDFSFDQKAQAQLKKQILQQLIKNQVIAIATKKMNFGISPEQLQMMIMELPIFQVNGHFSVEQYREALAKLNFTEADFLDDLERALVMTQLERGFAESEFILPNEIELTKTLFNQQRDFGYFKISPQLFAKSTKISDADINDYYKKHQDEFLTKEKVSIQYIQISGADIKNKIHPTSELLQKYYHDNILGFSTPKRWQIVSVLFPNATDAKENAAAKQQLTDIFNKAKAGQNLEQLAKDKAHVTWVTIKDISSPEIAQHLSKLEVGQISEPFQTKNGMQLIKVLAVDAPKPRPFAEVSEQVKKTYMQAQLTQSFYEMNDKLSDLTYTNSDSLAKAATALNLEIKTTPLFTIEGEKTGLLANKKVVKAAFSEAVLKQGYNSNPIEINAKGGTPDVIVLRIKDHQPQIAEPFAQVKSTIQEKLQQIAMQKQAADLGEKVFAAIQGGKSIADISKQYNLTWQPVTHVKRTATNLDQTILRNAFSLTKPKSGEVSAKKVELKDGSVAIIKFGAIYPGGSEQPFSGKAEDFTKMLEKNLGAYTFSVFAQALQNSAKITIEDESKTENANKTEDESKAADDQD